MNPVARRLAIAWVLVVGAMAAIDQVVFPYFGLFAWFPFSGVIWFGAFLAVTLVAVYVLGSLFGYTQGGGGSGGGSQRQRSKGARER
jgi:hypothetical protein